MSVVNSVRQMRGDMASFASRLISDIRGFAAVEFAMIVPVMIMMLLGCVEVCDALNVDGRVTTIAYSASLLVARCKTVNRADLSDVMRISDSLLGKYSVQALSIDIVALKSDADGVTTVLFSQNRAGSEPYGPGASYPKLPQGIIAPDHSGVVADVSYAYNSPFGQYIHGTLLLSSIQTEVTRDDTIALGAACSY